MVPPVANGVQTEEVTRERGGGVQLSGMLRKGERRMIPPDKKAEQRMASVMFFWVFGLVLIPFALFSAVSSLRMRVKTCDSTSETKHTGSTAPGNIRSRTDTSLPPIPGPSPSTKGPHSWRVSGASSGLGRTGAVRSQFAFKVHSALDEDEFLPPRQDPC